MHGMDEIATQDAFRRKLSVEFTTNEQQIFVNHFSAHLVHFDNPDAFVVDLCDAVKWLGFSRLDAAVRLVRGKLTVGVDFKLAPHGGGATIQHGGHNKERHMLTANAFKKLCMLAGTTKGNEVRNYYIKMENVLMRHIVDLLRVAPTTPDEFGLIEATRNASRRLIAAGVQDCAPGDRISVHMVVDELVRRKRIAGSAARDNGLLTRIGTRTANRFKGRVNSGQVVAISSDVFELTWTSSDSPIEIMAFTTGIAALCRMRHSLAYGLREVHVGAVHDPWTYPASFKADMEEIACDVFCIPVVARALSVRANPWS